MLTYGKLVLYNHIDSYKINVQEAFVAFKLASLEGHPEAHYYLSFMYSFNLDHFSEKYTFNSSLQGWNLQGYLDERSERLAFLNLYNAALAGQEKALLGLAFRYMKVLKP